jgi:hypothetical protein
MNEEVLIDLMTMTNTQKISIISHVSLQSKTFWKIIKLIVCPNIKFGHFRNEHERFLSLVIIMRDIIDFCISLCHMWENICWGLHFSMSTDICQSVLKIYDSLVSK